MPRPDHRSDAGVSLVITLVTVLFVSLVLLALGNGLTNDLLGSEDIRAQHTTEYAADGAASIAIQTIRYSGATYANTTGNCLSSGPTVQVDGRTMGVTCGGVIYDPVSGVTRVIDVWACRAATCSAANAVIAVQVSFDDYSAANQYNCTPGGSTSTCGTSQTINSWVVETGNN